jgi:two-component system NtrC family sensor kinase
MVPAAKLERILVVDEDPDVLHLLGQQILEPMGYKLATASDGATAIQHALQFGPDIIIASLTLPGLSGKDLLVALRSQGTNVPMLVTAPKGMESDAIQAFRLGAHDYLSKPLREAEVVSALERVIKEIRLRQEHRQLAEQLAESNRQLERRVRELTTLFGLGKTVTSTTNQSQLFSKLIEGSLYVTEADMGWVLVRSEDSDQLILRAERQLPERMAPKLQKPFDDGVSSLVMLSGETLAIQGEGLAKFKLAQFCSTALIAPVKVKDQPIGVIGVARQHERPFTERQQVMLEAVADYASISLVNARLFQALEDRAKRLEREIRKSSAEVQNDQLWLSEVHRSLRAAYAEIEALAGAQKNEKSAEQLKLVRRDIESVLERIDDIQEAKDNPS